MSLNPLRRPGLFLAVGLASGAFALAHVRLIHSSNGKVLFWEQPSQVTIVIQASGSDDIQGRGHVPALRNAIAEWNGATGTSARLLEVTNTAEQNSQDWASGARHLIMFDETNSSGFFPKGSGIVAVTPVSFFNGGNIIDADVLFNGRSFRFTTEGTAGRFDVQDVATHELGHVLGLDHTGAAGASLNPYVDTTQLLHRSISVDEVHGLRDAYPSAGHGTLGGQIVRSSNGVRVPGAWVAARDADGRLAGAALCDGDGRFTMRGMDPGTYTVYATPLDAPVSASNLTPGHSIQTNFESTVLGTAVISGTGTTQMGTRQVGPDVELSLGRASDDFPLHAVSGASRTFLLRGRGLWPGASLVASDPSLTIENVVWGGFWLMFDVVTPADEPPGHVDLTVRNGSGDVSILCAGIEVTPPDPLLILVQPAAGDSDGGFDLTILGQGFRSGLRVVIGDRIYVDGAPGGCTVVDSENITLTLKNTIPGLHDVVVIDSTGVEGRRQDGFLAQALPEIQSIFPPAGSANGGTQVTLMGDDFESSALVTINGAPQPQCTVDNFSKVSLVTEMGVSGGPYLVVLQNPSGHRDSAAFTYVDQPDPFISTVSPASGSQMGGQTVTISGGNFTDRTRVVFGASPTTGAGGTAAASVSFVDSGTLTVVTPHRKGGSATVMVQQEDTGQAFVKKGAYSIEGSGGGGGGCGAVALRRPPTVREVLAGGGWMIVLMLLLGARAMRGRRPTRGAVGVVG